MIYYFDVDGDIEEYDIADNDYVGLIDCCFKYCSYFKLYFKNPKIKLNDEPSPYRVDVKIYDDISIWKNNESTMIKTGDLLQDIYVLENQLNDYWEWRYYKCNEESKKFMCSITKKLFDMVNYGGNDKAENPVFYRVDNTAFFWSVTHEGICVLSNRKNEDVSKIVCKIGWHFYDIQKRDSNCLIPKYFFENS